MQHQSSEITEDNLVFQWANNSKKITFMGDDTWVGLFPSSFNRQFPYPSFNVKWVHPLLITKCNTKDSLINRDLDTVDNGILDNLIPELSGIISCSFFHLWMSLWRKQRMGCLSGTLSWCGSCRSQIRSKSSRDGKKTSSGITLDLNALQHM